MATATSSAINATIGNDLDSVSSVAMMTILATTDVLAIVGSLSVMVVIAKTPQLRILTLIFVFNLCAADLMHSLSSTPLAIATLAHGEWFSTAPVCQMTGFLDSFFTFGSISTVCVISVERYYSIVRPMVHAAYLTLLKALFAIAVIWLLALVFALAPLLGWNSYSYDPIHKECTFSWSDGAASIAYAIIISVVYFCIPAMVIITMYSFIYRTARKASRQVGPLPAPLLPADETPKPSGIFLQVPPTTPSQIFSVSARLGEPAPSTSTNSLTVSGAADGGNPQGKRQNNEPLKATKTLLLIVGLFIFTWGPYFMASLYHGLVRGSDRGVEEVVIWLKILARTSFALNSLVYGLLNRQVRLELHKAIRNFCKPAATVEPPPSAINMRSFDVDGSQVENFFQFLERTNAAEKKDETRTEDKKDAATQHDFP
ncbi:G-protein coupled receptor 61-like [Branchiostoma lanceolatum]|uniref:G-protein coupled receptor 61-like n=1 Tax=Branchiostoma lanceolatum TaxID=7740 RepID=UPI0034547D0A